jgi:hypothetical protein
LPYFQFADAERVLCGQLSGAERVHHKLDFAEQFNSVQVETSTDPIAELANQVRRIADILDMHFGARQAIGGNILGQHTARKN